MPSIEKVFAHSMKRIFSICFLVITFFSISVFVEAQNVEKSGTIPANRQSNNVQLLKLNQPIERQIKGGETHTFQFNVKAGEYARVEVEQKNIDVVVSLFAPDGELVIEMDGKDGRLWRETVSCIAEKDSAYRVEIKAYGTVDTVGSFMVKLAEMRLSVLNDRKRLEAEAHLSAGRKFFNIGGGGNFETAIKEYEIATKLWRELDERYWEGMVLMNTSWTLNNLSRFEQAVVTHSQALRLFQAVKDRVGEGKATNSLGVAYYNLGQFDNALKSYEQAILILRELKDRVREGQALNNLGILFRDLRQPDKAREYYEQSLAVKRETRDRRGEGVTLNNLGIVYRDLGQLHKALENYEQSLMISREFKDQRRGEGNTLNNLGDVYRDLKKYDKARDYYEQALVVRREIKDRSGEGHTLNNIGTIHFILGQINKAREYFDHALVIRREIKDRIGEGDTFSNLMYLFIKQNKSRIAIFYGKQAVNAYQKIRSNIKSFTREAQRSFLKNKEPLYRSLADIFISEGQLPEAQAVLDLLKEEEYQQLTRSGETSDTVPYSQTETDVIIKIENLVALELERNEIQKLPTRTAVQEAKLEQLRFDIAAANKAFDLALDALGKTEASASTRVDEIKGGQEIQSALTALGKETKSGVVALYTVLGADEEKDETGNTKNAKSKFGWVILVTEKGYKAYPIDVANLEETVFQFRNALTSDKYDPQPLAEKIYTAIFRQTSPKLKRTLEQDLREYLGSHKDKTLMWSLDGVLRYIPMAALHDGSAYLVENYRNVVFTKQSFLWLTRENQTNWKALGLGVSEGGENYSPLPGVKVELETIVREPHRATGIMNGIIRLNDNFKKQMFFNTVEGGSFPVVHIASHYAFNPTQQDASFLLIGDGRLTFSELKENKNLFGAVDLLTLSACDTGVSGNGKEAEGFAYLAQSLGAKSVIASLWKVSDEGTPELMIRFYKLRTENPNMSKGEAFRQAQISLLAAGTKNSKSNNSRQRDLVQLKSEQSAKLSPFVKDETKPFAHPHYWSSFVLIGNWR